MANPNYYLCDICKKPTNNRFFVTQDRKMDAAGSMEDVGDTVDLCEEHVFGGLKFFLNRKDVGATIPDHEQGIRLMGWIWNEGYQYRDMVNDG